MGNCKKIVVSTTVPATTRIVDNAFDKTVVSERYTESSTLRVKKSIRPQLYKSNALPEVIIESVANSPTYVVNQADVGQPIGITQSVAFAYMIYEEQLNSISREWSVTGGVEIPIKAVTAKLEGSYKENKTQTTTSGNSSTWTTTIEYNKTFIPNEGAGTYKFVVQGFVRKYMIKYYETTEKQEYTPYYYTVTERVWVNTFLFFGYWKDVEVTKTGYYWNTTEETKEIINKVNYFYSVESDGFSTSPAINLVKVRN